MRNFLSTTQKIIHWIEDGFLTSLLLVMILTAVAQILLRNYFDSGFVWAESFLRILVLWIGLAGAMAASREHRHINIDVISHFLPPAAKKIATAFTALFATSICALLAYYSYQFVKVEYEDPSIAFAMIPTWVCEAIMPVAFTIIALRYFILACRTPWLEHPTHNALTPNKVDDAP